MASPTDKVIRRKPIFHPDPTHAVSSTSTQRSSDGEVQSFASICCHCRSRIPFERDYCFCGVCRLTICMSCKRLSKHVSKHDGRIVSVHGKHKRIADAAEIFTCANCFKESRIGMACDFCNQGVCCVCMQEARGGISLHDKHTRFSEWVEPFPKTFAAITGLQDDSLCYHHLKANIHCGVCYKVYDVTKHAEHVCQTCTPSWPHSMCAECAAVVKASHPPEHQWRELLVEELTDSSLTKSQDHYSFHCMKCSYKTNELNTKDSPIHEHGQFRALLSNDQMLYLRGAAYRTCLLKCQYDIEPYNESGSVCLWCGNSQYVPKHFCFAKSTADFATRKARFCMICIGNELSVIYCEACFPRAVLTHEHGHRDFVCVGESKQLPLKKYAQDPTDVRLPDVARMIYPRTTRAWYRSENGANGTSIIRFEKPCPLPKNWSWWKDASGTSFFVNRDQSLAIFDSPLYIPEEAWTDAKYIENRCWKGKTCYRTELSGLKDLLPNTVLFSHVQAAKHPVLDRCKLPWEWILEHTGKADCGPWFSSQSHLSEMKEIGPTLEDPRVAYVQWNPIQLPLGWQMIKCADGSVQFLLDNLLHKLPPEVKITDDRQSPRGDKFERSDAGKALAEAMKAHIRTWSETKPTSSSKPNTPPAQPTKKKISKTAMAEIGLKTLSLGLQVGAALAGVPTSSSTFDFSSSSAASTSQAAAPPPSVDWSTLQGSACDSIQ